MCMMLFGKGTSLLPDQMTSLLICLAKYYVIVQVEDLSVRLGPYVISYHKTKEEIDLLRGIVGLCSASLKHLQVRSLQHTTNELRHSWWALKVM